MRFRRKRDKSISALDITPLVDVVFLLLIFFMLSLGSPLKVGEISLPESESGTTLAKTATVVAVSPVEIKIDGTPAMENELSEIPADRDIVVLASKDIAYFRVIDVLDILKTSGHERISLGTKALKK